MRLLSLIPLGLAVAAAQPALAQDAAQDAQAEQAQPVERTRPADQAQPVEKAARMLSDPAVQAGVAGLIGAFADALLDTRVGPMAHYADPRDKLRPDDTLRDLARRDDPDFDRHLADRTRDAVAATGHAARDAAAMQREIDITAAKLRKLLAMTSAVVKSYRDSDTTEGESSAAK